MNLPPWQGVWHHVPDCSSSLFEYLQVKLCTKSLYMCFNKNTFHPTDEEIMIFNVAVAFCWTLEGVNPFYMLSQANAPSPAVGLV